MRVTIYDLFILQDCFLRVARDKAIDGLTIAKAINAEVASGVPPLSFEDDFVYFSNRPRDEAKAMYAFLSSSLSTASESGMPLDFKFLSNVGVLSDSARRAAIYWLHSGAEVGVRRDNQIVFCLPITTYPTPNPEENDRLNRSQRRPWHLQQLADCVYAGVREHSPERDVGELPRRKSDWYPYNVGLNEILEKKAYIDEAHGDMKLKKAARIGWAPAYIEFAVRMLGYYNFSQKSLSDSFAEPVRAALRVMIERNEIARQFFSHKARHVWTPASVETAIRILRDGLVE